MAPSSRLGDGGGHPRATVSTHGLNYMRVANGLMYVGDRETDGNGNPSGEMVWQKNYMQHNHDETDMPGMPETPAVDPGRWLLGRPCLPPRLMALMTELSQTHRVEG